MTEKDVEQKIETLEDVRAYIVRQNHTIEQQKTMIKHLEAEIERLEGRVEATEISKQKLLACFNCAKSEAIKEFAERLKDCPYFDINNDVYFRGFDIDRILIELTQPTKIEHNSLCETETYKE